MKVVEKFIEALGNLMDDREFTNSGSWKEKAETLLAEAEDQGQSSNLEELSGWLEGLFQEEPPEG